MHGQIVKAAKAHRLYNTKYFALWQVPWPPSSWARRSGSWGSRSGASQQRPHRRRPQPEGSIRPPFRGVDTVSTAARPRCRYRSRTLQYAGRSRRTPPPDLACPARGQNRRGPRLGMRHLKLGVRHSKLRMTHSNSDSRRPEPRPSRSCLRSGHLKSRAEPAKPGVSRTKLRVAHSKLQVRRSKLRVRDPRLGVRHSKLRVNHSKPASGGPNVGADSNLRAVRPMGAGAIRKLAPAAAIRSSGREYCLRPSTELVLAGANLSAELVFVRSGGPGVRLNFSVHQGFVWAPGATAG